MIFPPESIYELRRELAAKLEAGELTEAEVFRQALAVDPNDPAALRFHAFMAEDSGDRARAEQFGRRFLLADPTSHEGYLLLGRVLADPALAAAYRALGEEKLHFDPEARQDYDFSETPPLASEPPAVSREMEPHRLIHQLFAAGIDAVEPDADRPHRRAGRRMFAAAAGRPERLRRGYPARDSTMPWWCARSPCWARSATPRPCRRSLNSSRFEDETLGGAARWAFLRIARRRPAETLEVIRALTLGAEALDLAALAQQLCLMPEVPGRKEALLGLAVNLPELDDDERALVVVSMITSAYVMEGSSGELADALEKEHGADLNREERTELKSIRAEIDASRASWIDEEPSIYEVACEAFEAIDEDEAVVRQEPKLGRNDPCWCGSGKKYKKCHLEADSRG